MTRAFTTRRGVILLSVLLVVAIAALAGTTAMYYGEAAGAGAAAVVKRTRSRAMAWSGIQAAMAELADQRQKLLDGEAPLITTQWQLFEESGRTGIIRLVSLHKDETGVEQWVLSETAKVDLNSATADMLAALGPLTKEQADAIVAARGRGFGSVEELSRVQGIKPEMLSGTETAAKTSVGSIDTTGETRSLLSLLSVFSFDPSVQSGFEPGAADNKGRTRVNLNTAWSDELGQAIKARFGEAAVASVKSLFDKGSKFKTVSDIVAQLRLQKVPAASWPVFLDAFECSPDPFIPGRVDINRATAAVIAAIPGFTRETADELVRRRPTLDAAAKRSVAWPLIQGVLKEDDFAKAVDRLTTRSLQWRARVEVGVMDQQAAESSRQPALEDKMVFEVVIDVASERPRVAYLRDVSMMDAARIMDESLARRAERRAPQPETAEPTETVAAPDAPSLDIDAKLKLSTVLDFGHEPEPVVGPPIEPVPPPSTPAAAEPVDRRIGRWTSRGGGTGEASSPASGRPQGGGTP